MKKQSLRDFHGSKVVVTGHTGFKGSWLSLWLRQLGAEVIGISLPPVSGPTHFASIALDQAVESMFIDIRDEGRLAEAIRNSQPDYVFHLAAQSLVHVGYRDPLLTYQTNALGTANLLEALRCVKKKCYVVLITSDKVYRNKEWCWGYRENDELGGIDPYSASKASAEVIIQSYLDSGLLSGEYATVGVARAGNVIGGGDWAESRIVPDCVNAWAKDEQIILRNPSSTRPWQHVLEPLSGYMNLALQLKNDPNLHGEAFNFGPAVAENFSVKELVELMSQFWNKGRWKEASDIVLPSSEAGLLQLNCDKALGRLSWRSVLSIEETAGWTIDWYRKFYGNKTNMQEFSRDQIRVYQERQIGE